MDVDIENEYLTVEHYPGQVTPEAMLRAIDALDLKLSGKVVPAS